VRIVRLYLQQCGVFNDTLIDFTRDGKPHEISCLAGVNGSGKTTVMELIFALFHFVNPRLSLQEIYFDRLKPHILSRTEFAQLDLLIEGKVLSLVLGDRSRIHQYDHPQQALLIEGEISKMVSRFEDKVIKVPEEAPHFSNKEIYGLQALERFSQRPVEKIHIDLFDPLLQRMNTALHDEETALAQIDSLPSVYFFNAHDREIYDLRYASIPKDHAVYQVTHRYNPKADDLKKKLIYYSYAYPERFASLKDWINAHVLVGKAIERIDRPRFDVLIKTRSGREHGLELLSAGEESLLIVATQLYLHTAKNSVVLIDEVDQSLHPEFQQRVINLLFALQKEKGCQIILTSHSEVVWDFFAERGLIDLTEVVF